MDARTGAATRSGWLQVALAIGLPAFLYGLTLYPGIGDRSGSGDAIEMQLVGRILGIPHETGYPQYVLLTYVWSLLPFPLDLATRVNLFSLVCGVTAALFFFLTARGLSRAGWSSVLTTWLLFTAPVLWRLSTQAEVYALHFAWVAAVLWAALRWRRNPTRSKVLLLLLLYALSFGNHLSMIAFAPGLAALLLSGRPPIVRDIAVWSGGIVAALIGAAQYLLLRWRSYHPHPTLLRRFPREAGWTDLYAYATGGHFRDKHWLPTGAAVWPSRLAGVLVDGARQLGFALGPLVVMGAWRSWRSDRRSTLFLLLNAATILAMAAAYEIRDWSIYAAPAWIVLGVLGSMGLADCARGPRWARASVLALVLAAVAVRITDGVADLRVTENPIALDAILDVAEPGSVVLVASKSQRQARVISQYYRHAVAHPASRRVRITTARAALEAGFHLEARTLYTRSPKIAAQLGRALVAVERRTAPTGEEYFVAGETPPIETLSVTPLAGSGLRLRLGDDLEQSLRPGRAYGVVIARSNVPRGLQALPTVSAHEQLLELAHLEARLRPGDALVLVLPALDAPSWPELRAWLADRGLDTLPADPPSSIVALWRVGQPDRSRALLDPRDTVHLPLVER